MWEGRVAKIYYQTEDFVIAKIRTPQGDKRILGNIYGLHKGDHIQIHEGEAEKHEKFGEQIRVTRWEKPL